MALTAVAINKAKGRAKPYKLTDGDGLFLYVTPTGTRLTWQGIDLTSLFAFSEVSIPSDMPSVH